jgi:hypothetical protein
MSKVLTPEDTPQKKGSKPCNVNTIVYTLIVLFTVAAFLFKVFGCCGGCKAHEGCCKATETCDSLKAAAGTTVDTATKEVEVIVDSLTAPEVALPYELDKPYLVAKFHSGKATYDTPDPELDKLVEALKQHPDLKVKILAYTDPKGSDEANKALSEARAKAVAAHLTEAGIDAARITAEGHGKALDPDYAKDRHAEFILSK